ncbi:MAG: ATP-binding protein [Elusimicrobiales bacterium]
MTETGAPDIKSECFELAKAIGRTMGQMALYGAAHPSVEEGAAQAHKLALSLAEQSKGEFVLAADADHVTANGKIVFGRDKLPSALSGTFERLHLSSITFRASATKDEVRRLCEIALIRQDRIKDFSAAGFLKEKNISGITLNATVYARIREGQKVVDSTLRAGGRPQPPGGGSGSGGGGGSGMGSGSGEGNGSGGAGTGAGGGGGASPAYASLQKTMSGGSLEDSLSAMVRELPLNDDERKRIMEVVLVQLKQELGLRVKSATEMLSKEKTRAQNASARTDTMLATGSEGMVIVDAGGKILMMNAAAEDIFGRKFSEVSGKSITEISRREQMITLSGSIATPDDKPIAPEMNVHGVEDTMRIMRQSSAIIRNDAGDIVGSTVIPPDMAKLREYDRLQKEFVANVTHELRSPLTSITAALGILNTNLNELSGENKSFLDTAMRNAQRLNSLIGDILDFSKLQSGKLSVHPEPCDAALIAVEAADAMRAWAQAKGVRLGVNAPPTLQLHAMADKARSVQALMNLISNAIKFTPAGGEITVSAQPQTRGNANYAAFSVKDTGPGIPKSDQQRIFERFVQIASGERMGGTGLGLPITKALVVMQRGSIELDSDAGRGATFTMLLPVSAAPRETPADSEAVPARKKKWWRRLLGE